MGRCPKAGAARSAYALSPLALHPDGRKDEQHHADPRYQQPHQVSPALPLKIPRPWMFLRPLDMSHGASLPSPTPVADCSAARHELLCVMAETKDRLNA